MFYRILPESPRRSLSNVLLFFIRVFVLEYFNTSLLRSNELKNISHKFFKTSCEYNLQAIDVCKIDVNQNGSCEKARKTVIC